MPADATDDELVRAAQRGDAGSFEALYVRYGRVVHAIVLGRVAAADADDVMQEIFITAYRKLHELRDPAAFAGWIARIARNRAADYRRSVEEVVVLDRDHGARATQADAAEAAEALGAIRTLPEAYRETLLLRLVEGMSGAEIAERTGLTPASVRVNIHRGMQLLREALGAGARR
jgi:RNA polymerase sigma-70 factor (ECF subfamily)